MVLNGKGIAEPVTVSFAVDGVTHQSQILSVVESDPPNAMGSITIQTPPITNIIHSDEDLARAVSLLNKHNAVADTRERARHFAQRACDALLIFPDSEARRAMMQAAQFAVARGY